MVLRRPRPLLPSSLDRCQVVKVLKGTSISKTNRYPIQPPLMNSRVYNISQDEWRAPRATLPCLYVLA